VEPGGARAGSLPSRFEPGKSLLQRQQSIALAARHLAAYKRSLVVQGMYLGFDGNVTSSDQWHAPAHAINMRSVDNVGI
jgi:hypothetical protein